MACPGLGRVEDGGGGVGGSGGGGGGGRVGGGVNVMEGNAAVNCVEQ